MVCAAVFGEASHTRAYAAARNAAVRAARPDPSLRKERSLQDDNQMGELSKLARLR